MSGADVAAADGTASLGAGGPKNAEGGTLSDAEAEPCTTVVFTSELVAWALPAALAEAAGDVDFCGIATGAVAFADAAAAAPVDVFSLALVASVLVVAAFGFAAVDTAVGVVVVAVFSPAAHADAPLSAMTANNAKQ